MNTPQPSSADLLWSLWRELGVPGTAEEHTRHAIDPEPLIAWTPHLARNDPRLLGLAFDWCAAQSDLISKSRFPGLVGAMPEAAQKAFEHFAGALRRQGVQWRPSGPSGPFEIDRTMLPVDLMRPSLVRFRIRGLVGRTTRAEVLGLALAAFQTKRPATVKMLTPSGVTKRSVERTVLELERSGIFRHEEHDHARAFSLVHARELGRLVGLSALTWTDWHRAFELLASLEEALAPRRSDKLIRVESARRFDVLIRQAKQLGLPPPPGPKDRDDLVAKLQAWSARILKF